MDHSPRQAGSNTQPSGIFFAGLRIFNGILNWLAGLVRLTEEEQKDAGIYTEDQRDK